MIRNQKGQISPGTPSLRIELAPGDSQDGHFDRSLQALLRLALRQAGADEVSLYEYSEATRTLVWKRRLPRRPRRVEAARIELSAAAAEWIFGLRLPEYIPVGARSDERVEGFPDVIETGFESVLVVPLLHDTKLAGVLHFGWKKSSALNHPDVAAAAQIGAAVVALLIRARQTSFLLHLAIRLSQLQAELADWKIGDRTRGLLIDGTSRPEVAAFVRQHVSRVLEAVNVTDQLEQQVRRLEAAVQVRRLISQAKELMRGDANISEEEAYQQLRKASRATRRPLRDVAIDVVRNSPRTAGTVTG